MRMLLWVGLVHGAERPAAEGSAAEGPAAAPAGAEQVSAGASVDGLGSGISAGSGSSGGSSSSGAAFKKGKVWGWTYRPYVTPGGGLSILSGGTAITGALDLGVRYSKEGWKGDLSVGGSYTTGAALQGYDVHGGNIFGRREKYWGLTGGLVLFYNAYGEPGSAGALDPSVGLDVPIEVTVGPRKYYAYGGVTPSFLFNEDRHVEGLPFGDELEWGVGAGLKLDWIALEVGFTSRITTIGVINTPMLSVSLSGVD